MRWPPLGDDRFLSSDLGVDGIVLISEREERVDVSADLRNSLGAQALVMRAFEQFADHPWADSSSRNAPSIGAMCA